jgi:hypothetical protein
MNDPSHPQPDPRPIPTPTPESGSCAVPPQPPLLTSHFSLGTSSSDADEFRIGLELARLEQTYSEPYYDDGYDDAREHELLMHDLADDNDDFARSDEEGWYYSDED